MTQRLKRLKKNDKIIADNIKKLRLKAKMTQEELQEKAGLYHGCVSKYEVCDTRLTCGAAYAMAMAMKINVKKFFEGCE